MSRVYDGQEFRRMIGAGTAWLEHNAAEINALNVFPVPDGDTGTNMMLTARAAYEEVESNTSKSAAEISQRVYRGAQFGSRGNSGVILSQLLRGYASALKDRTEFGGRDIADALWQASNFAYQGVTKPVEGTILTVAREAGDAALAAQDATDVTFVLECALRGAQDALARTPTMLKVLRDAGVVDAGGKGYVCFLEGMVRYLRGEKLYVEPGGTVQEAAAMPAFSFDFSEGEDELGGYGYCTEFIVEGRLNFDEFRIDMLALGNSAVVVGDDEMIKVHIHTPDPGAALSYATQRGSLLKVKIDNMDRQHKDFAARKLSAPAPTAERATAASEALRDLAVVVVAPGDGFQEIFASMGASSIISGGQTMNPSVQDLLTAIEGVKAHNVIVLPNNKNIIMTAQQAQELTEKKVFVVPSKTIPQGISAMLALMPGDSVDDNVAAMTEALANVQTVELARAVRSVKIDELDVSEGQTIGILNDEVVDAGDDVVSVAADVLGMLGIEDFEVISAYYGEDITPGGAEAFANHLADTLRARFDMPVAVFAQNNSLGSTPLPFGTLRIELHPGGQPHYFYIMSVE
ncbi:MAG: DAK2 domain-containing protein [Anaerolineae bacterium]